MVESLLDDLRSSAPSTPFHPPQSRDERIKEAAIHHAKLVQERKDTEMRILDAIELLIDYPTSTGPNDSTAIKQLLIPFQPSDFDALVEERNISRKCGYVLCPKANKLQRSSAKFGFAYSKGAGTKIVERKTLERWCSPECGKRALYLRVQLAEEPAWERIGGVGGDFVLLDEKLRTDAITETLGKLDVHGDEENMAAALKELAIERGDGNPRIGSNTLANIRIMENKEHGQAQPILPNPSNQLMGAYDEIEGYQPRGLQERTRLTLSKEVDNGSRWI